MENKTLLTVVALLLAGVVTVMLARNGTEGDENIFSANQIESRQGPVGTSQQPASPGASSKQFSYNDDSRKREDQH